VAGDRNDLLTRGVRDFLREVAPERSPSRNVLPSP